MKETKLPQERMPSYQPWLLSLSLSHSHCVCAKTKARDLKTLTEVLTLRSGGTFHLTSFLWFYQQCRWKPPIAFPYLTSLITNSGKEYLGRYLGLEDCFLEAFFLITSSSKPSPGCVNGNRQHITHTKLIRKNFL